MSKSSMPIEGYAHARAEIEAGILRDEVLARAGITPDEWTLVQREWLEKMGDELDRGRLELANRYTRAFVERQREITSTRRRAALVAGAPALETAASLPVAGAVPHAALDGPPPTAIVPTAPTELALMGGRDEQPSTFGQAHREPAVLREEPLAIVREALSEQACAFEEVETTVPLLARRADLAPSLPFDASPREGARAPRPTPQSTASTSTDPNARAARPRDFSDDDGDTRPLLPSSMRQPTLPFMGSSRADNDDSEITLAALPSRMRRGSPPVERQSRPAAAPSEPSVRTASSSPNLIPTGPVGGLMDGSAARPRADVDATIPPAAVIAELSLSAGGDPIVPAAMRRFAHVESTFGVAAPARGPSLPFGAPAAGARAPAAPIAPSETFVPNAMRAFESVTGTEAAIPTSASPALPFGGAHPAPPPAIEAPSPGRGADAPIAPRPVITKPALPTDGDSVPAAMRRFVQVDSTSGVAAPCEGPSLPFNTPPVGARASTPQSTPSEAFLPKAMRAFASVTGTEAAVPAPAGPALPFGGTNLAQPRAAHPVAPGIAGPELTVEQYASLCVELELDLAGALEILRRYRLTPEQKIALDAIWRARMAQRADVRQAWSQACERFKAWKLGQKNG